MTAMERIVEAALRLVDACTEDEYVEAFAELQDELGRAEASSSNGIGGQL